MAYADPAVQRLRDRERLARRTAERVAAGPRPRCGERPPAPMRSVCGPCAAKRNRASRARDARLRAAGKPRRNPAKARLYERERSRGERAARQAAGTCTRCGRRPAADGRSSCEPCLEKRRASDRAKYAAGKAAGLKYGGADADAKRRAGRAKSKRRQKQRIEAGFCIRCGQNPPVDGGTTCSPCREKRPAAERRQYAERRAAGCCTRCGGPVHDGLSRCARCTIIEDESRCSERKNALSRKRYAARRAAGRCTACGAPSQGAARCAPLCGEIVSPLRPFQGHPGLGPELDGDRAGDRPRARPVRQRGRCCALPRLREAGARRGRGAVRRQPDEFVHRATPVIRRGGALPAAPPARSTPAIPTCVWTAGRPPARTPPKEPPPCLPACPTIRPTASIRPSTTRTSRRGSASSSKGFAFAIPTALVAIDHDQGLAVCDRLNRGLGHRDRDSWTAFAARCLRAGAGGMNGGTPH